MRRGITLTAVLTLANLSVADAPVDPLPRADLDKRVRRAAHDAATAGYDLYTGGNHEGCARLYEGALIALTPMLDHRPDAAETVRSALARARAANGSAQKALVLRKALDELVAGPKGKPLWDRLGGQKAVEAVVHDFVLAAAADPKVNFFRDGRYKSDPETVARLERLVVEMVSSATGGPLKYTGRDMKTSHAGMRITDDEFAALAAALAASLKKFNVPQAEADELLTLVAATRVTVEIGTSARRGRRRNRPSPSSRPAPRP